MQLQIETCNICNAACVFCPYPQMKRPKGTMSRSLFEKIIDEAATVPAIDHVTLTGLGEPLLDPMIVDRIYYIRRKLPAVPIDLYTNGSNLTPQYAALLGMAGLSVLYVSLNAVNGQQRADIMRLNDFAKVKANVEAVIRDKSIPKVVVKAVMSKDLFEVGDNVQFVEDWGGEWDKGGHAFLHLEGNWAGATFKSRRTHEKACSRVLGQIMVLWDGRVSLCCFDGEGEVIFGDLNKETLREMYQRDPALTYRTLHNEGRRTERDPSGEYRLKLCPTCTAI